MKTAEVVLIVAAATLAQGATPNQIRSSASRAIAIVQRGATGFYKSQDCFSCHNHGLPMLAFRMARERGIPVDETAANQVAAKGLTGMPDRSSIDQAVQDPAIIDPAVSDGWALIAADAAGVRPNLVSAVHARRIANWQRADGHWPTGDARPPQSYSLFTATAVALRAMQLHMPTQLRQETSRRVELARKWLLTAEPRDTEDYTFRLFGLNWAGASVSDRSRAAHDLLALQRADGGWAQLPHTQPDAYATGEALMALYEAGGVPVTAPAWQKGLQYLLSTQDDRGAWHVRTRMISPAAVSPPYLETEFPYGHDQFLSTAATCWAAMAMMAALPKAAVPAVPLPIAALSPKGVEPWMETAMFGTTTELKAQLDGGLDPNSKTSGGTTLLMMVAADTEKVKLVISRGADVRAKAKTGFNALMVAATYTGTSESLKLLLAHGEDPRPGTGVMFNASPLFLAAFAGDRENVALLLSKGADANRKMNLIGMFPTSPLFGAVGFGDPEIIGSLLSGGANLNEKDPDSMTALHWATVANHREAMKVLIARGADVNAVDRFGYTPLLYATTIDFGNAEAAAALLQAGANPDVKDKEGRTPWAHADEYPYIRTALEQASAKR